MAITTFIHDKDKGETIPGWGGTVHGYPEQTFEGCVLAKYEHNWLDDSDFVAVVWNEDEQKLDKVEYATTRGWSYLNGAVVDATDEVRAKARKALADIIYDRLKAADDYNINEPFAAVQKGTRLELTRNVKHKGTTYQKGVKGDVFWKGHFGTFYSNGYKQPRRDNCRVGLRLDSTGEKVFVALSACKLDQAPTPDAELREQAEAIAEVENYAGVFQNPLGC